MTQAAMRSALEALRPFVDCKFTYFKGKVLGSDARLTREDVERGRAAISQLSKALEDGGEARDGWKLVPVEPTPEMVAAYLQANDAYWRRTDELPRRPDKWRTGTPNEATAESYRAMLSAAPDASKGGKPWPGCCRGDSNGELAGLPTEIDRVLEEMTTISDYKKILADHDRLVRELDVLLNGETDAASQASLCDIVAQVRHEGIRSTKS